MDTDDVLRLLYGKIETKEQMMKVKRLEKRKSILRTLTIPKCDYRHLIAVCTDENGVFRSDAPIEEYYYRKAKGLYNFQYSAHNWRKKLSYNQANFWCDIWFEHFKGS